MKKHLRSYNYYNSFKIFKLICVKKDMVLRASLIVDGEKVRKTANLFPFYVYVESLLQNFTAFNCSSKTVHKGNVSKLKTLLVK